MPTLTEVVDEASIVDRGIDPVPAPVESFDAPSFASSVGSSFASSAASSAATTFPSYGAPIDLAMSVQTFYRTPTPQEVESLRGDDAPFEATISDHQIRRALAESAARSLEAAPVDVSLADEVAPAPIAPPAVVQADHQADHAPIDERQLAERVHADVQRQVDAIFEHRLRETLAPVLAQVLAQVADTLASQARDVLATSLRDIVSQAVAREIDRQRGR